MTTKVNWIKESSSKTKIRRNQQKSQFYIRKKKFSNQQNQRYLNVNFRETKIF